MRVSDGQQTDLNQVAIHWELGRLLLDDVRRPPNVDKPSPWTDAMVRQWYLATATWMEKNEHLNKVHINRGREISSEVADSQRSVILNQVGNGIAIRMAVLERVLEA